MRVSRVDHTAGGPVARWPGGPVARWPGGPVARWPGARFDGREDGHRNVNVTFRAPGLAPEVPHGNAVQYWV
jgi:hypothetical protein